MAKRVQRTCGCAAEFRGERRILEGWRLCGKYLQLFSIDFKILRNSQAGGAIASAPVLGVGGLERQAARSSRGERRNGRRAMPQCRNALRINELTRYLLRCTMT
jgi:hypothetical protein